MTTLVATSSTVSFMPSESKQAVNAIQAAIGAASTDQARQVLTSVQVTFQKDVLKLVCTDSYRATRTTIFCESPTDEDITFLVGAKELKEALPKPSEFKTKSSDLLTLSYHPGAAKLDAGKLEIVWGNNQRLLRADPDGSPYEYPKVEDLIEGTIKDQSNGTPNEFVGWNPKFLKAIATEAAKLQTKDEPIRYMPGSTVLRPGMFKMQVPGINYESLLMPVRIEQ